MTAPYTSTAIAERATPRASILAKMAERFSVEPTKLLDTLKATAFKAQGGVTNEQMMALLIVADQYSLNPFTKEIFAFPDKNGIVPVVGVDGWARIINEHPQFDGVEFTYSGDAGDLACTCTIHRKDRTHPIAVTEYLSECKRSTGPWGSHPRRMLRHKALIQGARLAFGFAGIYDEDEAHRMREMGDAEQVERPGSSISAVREHIKRKGAAVDVVDMATGEVQAGAVETAAPPPADPSTPGLLDKPLPQLLAELDKCKDADAASLVLDTARHLAEPEYGQLVEAYRAKFGD